MDDGFINGTDIAGGPSEETHVGFKLALVFSVLGDQHGDLAFLGLDGRGVSGLDTGRLDDNVILGLDPHDMGVLLDPDIALFLTDDRGLFVSPGGVGCLCQRTRKRPG